MLQRAARRAAGKPFDLDRGKDEPTRYSLKQVNRYLGWLAVRLSERMQTSFVPGDLKSLLEEKPLVDSARFWTEPREAMFLYVSLLSLDLSCALLAGPTIRLAWVGLAGPAVYLIANSLDWLPDVFDFLQYPVVGLILSLIGIAFYFFAAALTSVLPGAVPWVAAGTLVAAGLAVVIFRKDRDFRKRIGGVLTVIGWFSGGLFVVFLHRLDQWYWLLPLGAVLGLYGASLGMAGSGGRAHLRLVSIFLVVLVGIAGAGWLGARLLGTPTLVWIAILIAGAIGLSNDEIESLEIALGAVLGRLVHGASGAAVGAVFLPLMGSLFARTKRRFATNYLFHPCLLTLLALRRHAPWRYRIFVAYATKRCCSRRQVRNTSSFTACCATTLH
jgi:multidrug transporter EmrE-like cation transporter